MMITEINVYIYVVSNLSNYFFLDNILNKSLKFSNIISSKTFW